MKCRLCLEPRALRHSHIIPEFLHKPLYDSAHRSLTLSPGPLPARVLRKGLREYLLCQECEIRIKAYEDYFANAWRGQWRLPSEIPPTATVLAASGLDYRLFKLFHLSVLWRASVSSLSDFDQVMLGPHAERIRVMLLQGSASDPGTYVITAALILSPGTRQPLLRLISVPAPDRFNGHRYYTTIYAGCAWDIRVSSHGRFDDPLALTSKGTLGMVIKDFRRFPNLYRIHREKRRPLPPVKEAGWNAAG